MKKSGLADSPLFSQPPVSQKEVWHVHKPFERTDERKTERSENRTVELPAKRRTKRYSFEFYEDQLLRLKQLKFKAEMAGESINLSEMVRHALDLYLKDKER